MKIVIVGVGKVGKTLASNFTNELHDVVAVDIERYPVENLVNNYDLKGIIGSGLEKEVLSDAGVSEADLFIACTSRDEMNVLSCVLAKKEGAKCTIARVREPELFSQMQNLRETLGVDLMFNPELTTAEVIENNLKFPSAKNLEVFAGGRALMAEFLIEGKNPVIGKNITCVAKEYGGNVLFAVVKRGEKSFIPHGDFVFMDGDKAQIIGSEKDIPIFIKKLKIFKPRAKSVILVGGGKISYHLATKLLKSDVGVKIIEKDENICQKFADLLPRATVIQGDGIDRTLLNEENISKTDALVTLTDSDEDNVVISLYALQKNVEKVITKVNRTSTIEMANFIGLDTVISPRIAVANQIIGYVRSHQSKHSGNLRTFYKLTDSVDAIEFMADDNFKGLNVPLKKLKVKVNSLIGGIVRDDKFVLPSGDTCIKSGDRVIVVTGIKQVTALSDVFK